MCGGLESFHNSFALVVHAQSGDNQPSNPKNSHERIAGCFCVGALRLSRGCGTGLRGGLRYLACQAVAFGQSFARSHAAGVLFRCGLCFRWIGGHTDRGSGRCGCFFRNCPERLRGHRVYRGFKIFKVPSRFLQGFCQVPPRFLPGFSQVVVCASTSCYMVVVFAGARALNPVICRQLHQGPRVGSLRCLCWGVWVVVRVGLSSLAQVQA